MNGPTQAQREEAKRQAEIYDQDEKYMLAVVMWREALGEDSGTWPLEDTLIAWLVASRTAQAKAAAAGVGEPDKDEIIKAINHHISNLEGELCSLRAAEVGGGIGSFPEDDPRPGAFHRNAAAEVGPRYPAELFTTPEMLRDKLLEVEAATIERCAQELQNYWKQLDGVPRYYVQEAEKRISALKDKKPESKP